MTNTMNSTIRYSKFVVIWTSCIRHTEIRYSRLAMSIRRKSSVDRFVLYDVTILYLEIDQEDQLWKNGFSKEGKHQSLQIVLGLLVCMSGYLLTEGQKTLAHIFNFG